MSDTTYTATEAADEIRRHADQAIEAIQSAATPAARLSALLAAKTEMQWAARIAQWAADDLASGRAA